MTLQEEVKARGDVDDEKSSSGLFLNPVAMQWIFLFLLIAWALVNALLYTDQASKYEERKSSATLSDIASSFGLETGKEYSITVVGASGAAISVALEGDNGSHILEVPTSKITFDVRRDVEGASMSVDIPNIKQSEEVAYWLHSYACSKDTWAFGWLQKNCSPNPPYLVVSDDARSQGLALVIEKSAGARITLSPSMYNDILGINPGAVE
jgi:hypothetical protein